MQLYTYYNYIIKSDFLTKFNYKNINFFLNIKKVILVLTFRNNHIKDSFTIKELLKGLLLLELLSNQKGCIFPIKKKIKNKKKLVGFTCKVTLRTFNIYNFLNNIIILHKKNLLVNMQVKDYSFNKRGNCLFILKDLLNFKSIPVSLFFQWKIPLQIYVIKYFIKKKIHDNQKEGQFIFNSLTLITNKKK